MSVSVTVYQPRYYPQLHYLARVQQSDVFLIYDDVEFSRQSRQHRAEIDFGGARWLTIPVRHTGNETLINEAEIDMTQHWPRKHLKTITAKYGGDSAETFKPAYDALGDSAKLVDITIPVLKQLFDSFNVDSVVYRTSRIDVEPRDDPSEYLALLVEAVGGDEYISGGTGYQNYLQLAPFDERDIDVTVQDWEPTWPDGNTICLDVLFEAETPGKYIR